MSEPLVCIVCVACVDPLSDEAEGWVEIQNSVDEGDDHDDAVWKCPQCATAADKYFAKQRQREALKAVAEAELLDDDDPDDYGTDQLYIA